MCLFQHLPLHCRIELTEEKKIKISNSNDKIKQKKHRRAKKENGLFSCQAMVMSKGLSLDLSFKAENIVTYGSSIGHRFSTVGC